jgi:signal transduction histidine kinase
MVGFSARRSKGYRMSPAHPAVYRDLMTLVGDGGKRVLSVFWAGRTGRAVVQVLAGLALAAGGWLLTSLVLLFWGAAIFALVGYEQDSGHTAIYITVAAVGLFPLFFWVRAFSALQRARFRRVLGLDILVPPRPTGSLPVRLIRAARTPATWRQVGYHLLALPVGVLGGLLALLCWTAIPAVVFTGHPLLIAPALALLLVAPWVTRGVAWLDEAAARSLLGPSRNEELTARVDALARSRAEIVKATDAERRRIERDLHDGTQQRLLSLSMNLGMARAALSDDVPEPARRAIEQAHDEAVEALADLREFVRGLHPAVLNDRGLDAALSGIVARAPLPVRLQVDVGTRCAPSIEAIAYFTVAEALTNVTKHSRATHAEVSVARRGDWLHIRVTDDGRGGATPDGDGSGLLGLAQRAAAVDGKLRVDSPVGGPTTISVELPCES